MTQVWQDEKVKPVTVIKAEPNTVALLRSEDKHGYQAVQLQVKSPVGKGQTLREFRVTPGELKVGDIIDVSVFAVGDKVKVTGISKGKGFQGVVKRHGFSGAPKSHGTKDQLRAPGSIGAGGIQRVFKGTRMAGRTGGDTVSVKNLKVVSIDKENNTISLGGAVPGAASGLIIIRKI